MTNSQMSHVKCQRSGFSLLEVLMVVAIIAVLGTIGTGAYRNFVKNVELNSVTRDIIFDLKNMQAKSIAGEDERKWGAHFVNSTSTDDYHETFSTPAGGSGYGDASTTIKSTVYLPAGITFSDPVESATKDILFNRVSGTTSTSTTVSITSADGAKTINVTTIGNIY